MFHKEEKNSGFNIKLFDAKNPSDIKALNATIDAEIARANENNKSLNLTYTKMVDWLKGYVNSTDFISSYDDCRSLELVAEATFWSVKLGLEPLLAKMSYADIRTFHPLSERIFEETERAKLIDNVCKKLTKPANSHEVSYALGQAAWCVYVHNNSFNKVQEERLFDAQGIRPSL